MTCMYRDSQKQCFKKVLRKSSYIIVKFLPLTPISKEARQHVTLQIIEFRSADSHVKYNNPDCIKFLKIRESAHFV